MKRCITSCPYPQDRETPVQNPKCIRVQQQSRSFTLFLCFFIPETIKAAPIFAYASAIPAGVWVELDQSIPFPYSPIFPHSLLLSPPQAKMSAAMSRRIRAVFGAANFWAIILYNILALNSLEFALLVTKRLLLTGKMLPAFPIETPLS